MTAHPSPAAPALAYLVSQYPAASHTFILREVRRLRQLGFRIDVASINRPDRSGAALAQEEREEEAVTYYVKADGVRGALSAHWATVRTRPGAYFKGLWGAARLGGTDLKRVVYALFYFVEAVMVGHWLTQRGFGHLHVHFATPAATVGLIAKRVFGIGFSMTVHGPDEFYDAPGYRLAEKIDGADFICCIGYYCRSQLMKLSAPAHWSKFEIAPLGVDPKAFSPRPFRAQPTPFEILCVGRLVPAKGQHVLIAALAQLVAEGRDLCLRLVGDGPDRAALEAQGQTLGVTRHLIFEGVVNQDRIRAIYAEADCFALASFAEGIPVVLMEAMAMEIPCVTTFITGHPELIRDGIDGLLVAPSDTQGLAAAIAALMDDPARRQQLGAAGRQRVIEHYDLEANTNRLAEILRHRLETTS
ncbi:colanic acid biosynthesis glycosyltransferase WcaL [Thiocapsa imhoffii]|uniref:Colanic acid biosynthesis glycosyltransferase WcaL n=1 Tax=Thiocapsa imhoffii TaxID=382777 RepID=A0A9X1B843_9GAMM|nr:glycosyltransferase family 4 protein [Thiocapsa imhoffii]MBK1643685.1 colanic acid biosynthesis glycosyltransferase WcaL [Thiocapsa imhoffii]